jgi:hypothetical protein
LRHACTLRREGRSRAEAKVKSQNQSQRPRPSQLQARTGHPEELLITQGQRAR